MAAESIGAIYSTKIPGYADNADIQAAFKLYHYGSAEYNSANANTANLVNPSIAYTLNDIQSQITALDPAGGISKSIIDAKGDLLVGSANDTVDNLTVGSNNFILTADSSQTLGIKWAAPEITATNIVTFTNKSVSLTTNTLTGTIAQFNTAVSDADFATLAGTETLTNKSVSLTNNTLTGTKAQFNTAMSDADFATIAGTETLTNKTLTSPIITGLTLNDSSIVYANTDKREYIAVASEGDYRKYSEEFKNVLIKLGLPEGVFKMKPLKNVDELE
jgi:hypothetical protein